MTTNLGSIKPLSRTPLYFLLSPSNKTLAHTTGRQKCRPIPSLRVSNPPFPRMTDQHHSPQDAPPLALPPAVLHFGARAPEPHPDSREAVDDDRYRTARELRPIQGTDSYSATTSPVIRSRGTSLRPVPTHGESPVTTAVDSLGPDAQNVRRYRLERQVPHWYDPVVKFWKSQVSVTIDEGSHRDHLGLSSSHYLTVFDLRKDTYDV
jgi:hypothetical protein